MWPLHYFESNTPFIPEFDNSPQWDGMAFYLLAMLMYLSILFLTNKNRNLSKNLRYLIIGIGSVIAFLPITLIIGNVLLMNVFVFLSLFAAIIHTFLYTIYLTYYRRLESSVISAIKRYRITGIGILILLFYGVTVYVYFRSYAYFLPASYPPAQRAQLRMIRRIIEIEPNGHNWDKAKLVPLSEAHLAWQGKELIPDSIRQQSEFLGYKYLMQLNQPNQKLYTLDVIPIQYQKGMHSYHVYCINSEELARDTTSPYIIYCTTMADHAGKPATELDRHFHDKSLWKMWVNR
ncbi:MAG: hypothetical protein ACE14V_14635 [bacterium]